MPISTYVELQKQYLDAVDGLLDTKKEALEVAAPGPLQVAEAVEVVGGVELGGVPRVALVLGQAALPPGGQHHAPDGHQQLDDHHHVVGAHAFLHAYIEEPRDQHHDDEGREVQEDRHTGQTWRGLEQSVDRCAPFGVQPPLHDVGARARVPLGIEKDVNARIGT